MNKNQLWELLEELTISFAEVANTLVNTRREPEDKQDHQKKVEEELGNLSQKIEQIALNYAASTSRTGPRPPVMTISHITHNCLLERKQKRNPKERQSTNYVGWADPYDNNQKGWVEDKVYALAEKCHQPYPVNSNREKRIQAQLGRTWEN
ncbi:22829_t:CDS:2 [Gigaspora margarita]|uniref:22829_t:CDS:1 n=1 Tax=Gigaspora margarita TaxID=4874 RepID=A0ABN7UQX3_GIGMA|nr:22829_t:CDS:2 [Gigaspora margarita]